MSEAMPALLGHAFDIVASGTTLTLSSVYVESGDTLILCVMHRSSLTTPSGYTVLSTVGPVSGDAQNQRVTMLVATAASTTNLAQSVTVASSGRIGAVLLRFRGVVSVARRSDLELSGTKLANATVVSSAKGSERVVVWGMAQVLWSSTLVAWASTGAPFAPAWPDQGSGDANRLGVFVDYNTSAARTFTPDTSAGAVSDYYTVAAVELVGETIGGGGATKRYLNVSGTATAIQ